MEKNLEHCYSVVIPPQALVVVSGVYLSQLEIHPELDEFDDAFRDQFIGLEISATPEAEIHVWEPKQKCLSQSILDELGQDAKVGFSQFCVFLDSRTIKTAGEFVTFLCGKDGRSQPVRASGHMGDGCSHWVIWPIRPDENIGWDSGDRIVSCHHANVEETIKV